MLRSHICRQCRARLLPRTTTPRRPQWQPTATFISLRKVQPQPLPDAQPSPAEASPDTGALPAHDDQNPSSEAAGVRRGRYSRREQPTDAPQRLQGEALVGEEPTTEWATADVPALSPARAIEQALAARDIDSAWALFLEHYPSRDCPALVHPAADDIALVSESNIFSRLLTGVRFIFTRHANASITPTQVLFRCAQLGVDSPTMWAHAIGHLTDQLLWAVREQMVEGGGKSPTIEARLKELLSLWRLLFQCKGEKHDPLETLSLEWPHIPDMATLMNDRSWSSARRPRMEQHHPRLKTSPALQFSAITLFNLFDDINQESFKVPDALKEEAAPFIRLVTSTVAGMPTSLALRHTGFSRDFQRLPEDYRDAVIEQIKSAPVYAMKLALAQQPQRQAEPLQQRRSPGKPLEQHRRPDGFPRQPRVRDQTLPQSGAQEEGLATEPQDLNEATEATEADRMIGYFIKKINDAVTQRSHVGRLEKVWDDIIAAYRKPDKATHIPPVLYNTLLSGFMNLRQPQQTVVVWNHMISNGVRPDMRTWNAMLDGCIGAKDFSGFKAIWERMLKSGANPDIHAWTTRIHGLVSFNEIAMAFAAMDEMGNNWLNAEKAMKQAPKPQRRGKPLTPAVKVNKNAKPTIEVINGALSAILQSSDRRLRFKEKLELMQKILRWAGQFDIKPDVLTYNILIQLYIDEGDYTTTFKLLRQMENEGLEGDLVTHTLLIRSAFNSHKFDNLSESEQADRALELFAELEAGGLKLSDRIYSITIDRLLKIYANLPAVRAVMAHMSARDITPEPAVYTSLITHYFQESPPNIEAVDALLLRIFSSPRERTDKYFYDRLIEGYARFNQVGRMMSVLTRMSGLDGKLPGYRALTAVVRALVKAGDWPRARQLVKDVEEGVGVARGGVTGGKVEEQRFLQTFKYLQATHGEELAGEQTKSFEPASRDDLQEAELADRRDAADEGIDDAYEQVELSGEGGRLNASVSSESKQKTQEEVGMGRVNRKTDDEYVYAEHTGYLVDEHEQESGPSKQAV